MMEGDAQNTTDQTEAVLAAVTIGPCGHGCLVTITADNRRGSAVMYTNPAELRFLADQFISAANWMDMQMEKGK